MKGVFTVKETIYRKVTVYIMQDIEFSTQDEREKKIAELETDICLDLDNMQEGGNSKYEYRYNGLDDATKRFPFWIFDS